MVIAFLSNHIRIHFHTSEFFVINIVNGIYGHEVLTSILNWWEDCQQKLLINRWIFPRVCRDETTAILRKIPGSLKIICLIFRISMKRQSTSWTVGIRFPEWKKYFYSNFIAYRLVLGSTQAPIQWVTGAVFLGLKWQGKETGHSFPSSA
jgi:hypothetical protein